MSGTRYEGSDAVRVGYASARETPLDAKWSDIRHEAQWSGMQPFQEDTSLKRIVENLPDAGLPAQRPKGVLKARVNEGVMQMPQYVMVYLGGNQPSSPEEGKQHFAKYMEWLASLGDSAVSPANPLKGTSTVHSDGTVSDGGTTTMSGYTIVEANSMEEALSFAKTCPFLDIGGSLEVSELVVMPSQK